MLGINTIIEACYSSNTKSTKSSNLGSAQPILGLSDLIQQAQQMLPLLLAQQARVHNSQIDGRSGQVHNVGQCARDVTSDLTACLDPAGSDPHAGRPAAKTYRRFASVSSTCTSLAFTLQSILHSSGPKTSPSRSNSGRTTTTSRLTMNLSPSLAGRSFGWGSPSCTPESIRLRKRAVQASCPNVQVGFQTIPNYVCSISWCQNITCYNILSKMGEKSAETNNEGLTCLVAAHHWTSNPHATLLACLFTPLPVMTLTNWGSNRERLA